MTGILLTKVGTPVIGWVASLLGLVMEGIYSFMDSVFGVQNLGVCIILLTIVIYTLMLPLTLKQQKFSRISAAMNPELQKIQKKYQGKRDQASMQKMQDETQMVYEKYGTSPTGGCLSSVIQLIVLWPMWYVIRSIPAYVGQVKAVYLPLITELTATDGWQKIMESIGKAKPIMMDPSRYDYSKQNIIIDVLYKFQSSTWETLADKFPSLGSTIDATTAQLHHMNDFLGLNIAEAPATLIPQGFKAGAWGVVIMALLIPVLAGLTQYLSVKITSAGNTGDPNSQMASTMKTMNVMFPMMSVFMSFTLPTGLGIYWVVSALVRTVQMVVINKQLDKQPLDEMIKKNMEKAAKKRENKKQVEGKTLNEMARKNVKNIHEPVRTAEEQKVLDEKLAESRRVNENAKEGSLASKANLVKRFNETNR